MVGMLLLFCSQRNLEVKLKYGTGAQPDWDGSMAQNSVPAAAFLAYTIFDEEGLGVYVAYNPYEGPVPAILPNPPQGLVNFPWASSRNASAQLKINLK